MNEPTDPAIKGKFDSWEPQIKDAGLRVRQLIFETAKTLPEVGKVFETLKWNQPSYLTPESGSGSTIRIDAVKNTSQLGVYFHCQTSLVDTFKAHYADKLRFDKNRAILLDVSKPLPVEALRHCIGLALTYHSSKPGK